MTYARSVFIIHNIAHQGRGPLAELSGLEVREQTWFVAEHNVPPTAMPKGRGRLQRFFHGPCDGHEAPELPHRNTSP